MIELKKELNADSRKLLRTLFTETGINNYKLMLNVLSGIFSDKGDVRKLEEMLKNSDCQKYFKDAKHYSSKRFENTLNKIGNKIIRNANIEPVCNILKVLGSEEYLGSLKLYFLPPTDYELFDYYESLIIDITEQSVSIIGVVYRLSEVSCFINIRDRYKDEYPVSYIKLLEFVKMIILQFREFELVDLICTNIVTEKFKYIIKKFESESNYVAEHLNQFFSVLSTVFMEVNRDAIADLFKMLFWSRQAVFPVIKNHKELKRFILRYVGFIIEVIPGQSYNLEVFASTFKYESGHPAFYLWEAMLNSENPIKTRKYLEFFSSQGFISFYDYYKYDVDILKFLIDHILILLNDVDVSDFPKSLLPLILKLFIEQKVDRGFLRRRTEFAKWLQSRTKSEIIRGVFVKILFYEYIFLFQKKFESNQGIVLKKFCDNFHQAFCKIIDQDIGVRTRINDKEAYFIKIYNISRAKAWEPVFAKYPDEAHRIRELSNISEGIDGDDRAISGLLELDAKFIVRYHNKIIEITKSPSFTEELLQEAFNYDYWCRYYYENAQFEIAEALYPVIGTINTYPDPRGNRAYTNGISIYLPRFISNFQDDPENREDNRNLSMYIAFGFHEAGHIISGSFKYSFTEYYVKYEYPMLIKNIHNAIEDYRIEQYLIKARVHSQIGELFRSSNIFLSYKIEFGFIDSFIINIIDVAAGYQDIIEKLNPQKREVIERILVSNINSGRFSSLKNARDYFIERVKNMRIINPFESFMIAEELYHLIKLWPIELIEEAVALINQRPEIETATKAVLSQEALRSLYEQCNSNPKQFYRDSGFQILEGIFKGDPDLSTEECRDKSGLLESVIDYEADGTFDTAIHTKVDEVGADRQKEFSLMESLKKIIGKISSGTSKKVENEVRKKRSNIKTIRSYSAATNSRSILTHCREYEISSVNHSFLKENRNYQSIIQNIYSLLSSMMINTDYNLVENSTFEGDLDLDRLVEILSDKGTYNEPDFLENQIEDFKSLRVIIGLDVSGSTSYPIGHVDCATILDVEKHFALIFAKALRMLTDNIEIYGFNSMTSTNIYKAVPLEAVTSFVADNANRDGDFIRYINDILKRSNEDLKYFFLITDGQPDSINYQGKEAMDDTLLALRECRKSKTRVVYFNIDSQLREYFYLFKNEVVFAQHFSNPKELIAVIPELVKKIAGEIM